jgi:hypothetical protein
MAVARQRHLSRNTPKARRRWPFVETLCAPGRATICSVSVEVSQEEEVCDDNLVVDGGDQDFGGLPAAGRDRRQRPQALSGRRLGTVFRAAALRRPGPPHHQPGVRIVLVGDPVPRHHAGGDLAAGLFLRHDDGRHHAARPAARVPAAQLHRDGPAETRRAAQGGQPHRGARKSPEYGRHHPPARCPHPRCSAAQRDLRLGRSGVGRIDHADAGHVVRLSVRAATPAHALVQRRDLQHQRTGRHCAFRARALRGNAGDGRGHDGSMERAGQRAATL